MTGPKRRLSKASQRVLEAMYAVAPDAMYGMELMDAAAAPSGTLYPILARYRDYGWLTAEREDIDPTEAGRPADLLPAHRPRRHRCPRPTPPRIPHRRPHMGWW